MMKRSYSVQSQLLDYSSNQDNHSRFLNAKSRHKTKNIRVPLYMVQPHDAMTVEPWVVTMMKLILEARDNTDSHKMVEDNAITNDLPNVTFAFFLGAQGKEFIQEIKDMFPLYLNSMMFISSSLDEYYFPNRIIHRTTSRQCGLLTSYFQLNDPLGGGIYPLNCLLVIDSDHLIRAKIAIRFNRSLYAHEKFGVSFNELENLIDDILQAFTEQDLNLIKIF